MNHSDKLEMIIRLRDQQQRLQAKMKRIKAYPHPKSINIYRKRVKTVLAIVVQYQDLSEQIAKIAGTRAAKRAKGSMFTEGLSVVDQGAACLLSPRKSRKTSITN